MAAYTTLAVIKSSSYLDIQDTADDAGLEQCINAASGVVDTLAGRRFHAVSETRYHTAVDPYSLWTGDILSVTSIAVDAALDRTYSTAWAAADWELWPANAPLDGRPYRAIRTTPLGAYTFPLYERGVKVVGDYGFCLTGQEPYEAQEAAALISLWLWKRHKAIFGVSGAPEFGMLSMIVRELRADPDVRQLMAGLLNPSRLSP